MVVARGRDDARGCRALRLVGALRDERTAQRRQGPAGRSDGLPGAVGDAAAGCGDREDVLAAGLSRRRRRGRRRGAGADVDRAAPAVQPRRLADVRDNPRGEAPLRRVALPRSARKSGLRDVSRRRGGDALRDGLVRAGGGGGVRVPRPRRALRRSVDAREGGALTRRPGDVADRRRRVLRALRRGGERMERQGSRVPGPGHG